jgi:hypothetical protein
MDMFPMTTLLHENQSRAEESIVLNKRGRCDGHHEMIDFRLRKIGARQRWAIKKIETRG